MNTKVKEVATVILGFLKNVWDLSLEAKIGIL